MNQTQDGSESLLLGDKILAESWKEHADRGAQLVKKFMRDSDEGSLQEAIGCYTNAAEMSSKGVGDAAYMFERLAYLLDQRFKQKGDLADLTATIAHDQTALELTPQGHPHRSIYLNNFALSLKTRFEKFGDRVDLDAAIVHHQAALELRPPGHPSRSSTLTSLAGTHRDRFDLTGDRVDLDAAIVHHQAALELRPLGHPDRSSSLGHLANTLLIRFRQIGDPEDLDAAILYYQAVLELSPPGHPKRSRSLNNLASTLHTRFNQAGNRVDLDVAIAYHQSALELTPTGHSDRSMSLRNLASALLTRFEQTGARVELDAAILYHQAALKLTPPSHSDHSSSLYNLASALEARFKEVGDQVDLTTAIVHHQAALELRPPGHPERDSSLGNLANVLQIRFEQVGDRADLDAGIVYHQAALELRPPGHPFRSTCLSNLAVSLQTRFGQTGDRSDMNTAFVYHMAALELRPSGHPNRSASLTNVASALQTRFELARDQADLDNAVMYCLVALELTPPGHPLRFMTLGNLGNSLEARFTQYGYRADLDAAVSYHYAALKLSPPGHPNRSGSLRNYANALTIHFEKVHLHLIPRDQSNMVPHILATLEEAASSTIGGPPSARLRAALDWVNRAVKWSHATAIQAFRSAFALLEIVLANHSSLETRHLRLRSWQTQNLAVDGAACAIDTGQIEIALELLEQGRTMLLTQAGKYRTQVDDLEVVKPALAAEFRAISAKMEASAMNIGHLGSEYNIAKDPVAEYQKLAEDWKDIVNRIRIIEGFNLFLKPTPFIVLQTAAEEGPVILLNLSRRRSDAIIVRHDNDPHLVPLRDVTPGAMIQLARMAHSSTTDRKFKRILYDLWRLIVEPIVKVLREDFRLRPGSRIWWCPTGATLHLPLHAAGDYDGTGKSLPDTFISSYTPTLSALVRSRLKRSIQPTVPSILIIGQSQNPTLPSVRPEIEMIQAISEDVCLLDGGEATPDRVMETMTRHSWVHLACHGHLDEKRPFRSSFTLYDGPLTLLDIASLNIPNAELAFLSACHSAEGSRDRPDEVLHLTAAVQFAGFRSVVGTLWAVNDADGPLVAETFYSNMLGSGGGGQVSSALALHRAVATLRLQPDVSISRWACFVHYGC